MLTTCIWYRGVLPGHPPLVSWRTQRTRHSVRPSPTGIVECVTRWSAATLALKSRMATVCLSTCSGFRGQRQGLRIKDSGSSAVRTQGAKFRVHDLGFRIQNAGFRIQDSEFGVWGHEVGGWEVEVRCRV